ncbi:MAG: Crp/Fnr family transcriptional regulator [Acidobacteria bacterium]|nr:Crp/Fnr family transcriptional regulator [Acidobacteriota bacterium]
MGTDLRTSLRKAPAGDITRAGRNGGYCSVTSAPSGSLGVARRYAKDSIVFVEGDSASAVYIVRSGRAKISNCSAEGRVTVVEVVAPAGMIGICGVIGGGEYETTAETIEDSILDVVPAGVFMTALSQDPELGLRVARQMASAYRDLHQRFCSVEASDHVLVKLAKLFLGWSYAKVPNAEFNGHPLSFECEFTHQQIAEMIGSARETVTRTLRTMRESGLLTLKDSSLTIHKPGRLRIIAGQTQGCR